MTETPRVILITDHNDADHVTRTTTADLEDALRDLFLPEMDAEDFERVVAPVIGDLIDAWPDQPIHEEEHFLGVTVEWAP